MELDELKLKFKKYVEKVKSKEAWMDRDLNLIDIFCDSTLNFGTI